MDSLLRRWSWWEWVARWRWRWRGAQVVGSLMVGLGGWLRMHLVVPHRSWCCHCIVHRSAKGGNRLMPFLVLSTRGTWWSCWSRCDSKRSCCCCCWIWRTDSASSLVVLPNEVSSWWWGAGGDCCGVVGSEPSGRGGWRRGLSGRLGAALIAVCFGAAGGRSWCHCHCGSCR